MKTESKSTHVFQLRLWSKKYYEIKGPLRKLNIFDGMIIDEKTKKKIHFHSPSQMLATLEMMYGKNEAEK